MRCRNCVGVIHLAVVLPWCAQALTAECWTTSDGREICSSDPTGLRATWWFFFVLLLFAGAATGCYDFNWWPCEQQNDATAADQGAQASHLESGQLNDRAGETLIQPLLGGREAAKMLQQEIPSPPKPVYRYL